MTARETATAHETATAREAVIRIRGLRNQFGRHVVHDGLDLDVYRGEILGVVGGSGTGKSVLLRTIAGLQQPVAGEIAVLGTNVRTASEAQRAALERRWGVMFQDGALFSSLNVRENVEVPMKSVKGLDPAIRTALAELKIALSGLPYNAGRKFPSELSGGMRKRAGLARALAIGAAEFDILIRQLSDTMGLTVFLVTHDLDTLHAICDRIAVLAENKVLVTGTMQDMMRVDHPWVRQYFHGPRARAALGATAANKVT